jgi:hypothetical protein
MATQLNENIDINIDFFIIESNFNLEFIQKYEINANLQKID